MHAAVTLHINAPPDRVRALVSDTTKIWRPLGGFLWERRNRRDMLRTLERVKAVAVGSQSRHCPVTAPAPSADFAEVSAARDTPRAPRR